MRSLILDLITLGRQAPDGLQCGYDHDLDMSRLPDGRFAIDVRGSNVVSKKKDIEKGEDQKDRW